MSKRYGSLFQAFGAATLAAVSLNAPALAAEPSERAAPTQLATAKHTLEEALLSVSAEGGTPISAKFEFEEGKLWLSVYGAKGGLDHCAERNELFELKGEASASQWQPKREVFQDKAHIARASAQLTLMQTTSLTLAVALKKAEAMKQGAAFSAVPLLHNGRTAIAVQVRAASGQTTSLVIEESTK